MPMPAPRSPLSPLITDLPSKALDPSRITRELLRAGCWGPKAVGQSVHDTKTNGHSRRNFAEQDYLGLTRHPRLRNPSVAAPGAVGAQATETDPLSALHDRIARLLHLPHALTFTSGTDAIRAGLCATLGPSDVVIVDSGANSAMFETVLTVGASLLRSPSGSVEAVERRLRRLSASDRKGGLWVAVSAISAYGSTVGNLADLAAMCRTFGARLIVDVTHDLGSMGQGGGGVMEVQACEGRADLIVGSFSKCFGAAGGFVAFRDPALLSRLSSLTTGQGRPKLLSRDPATKLLAACDIIEGREGRLRRLRLHSNALRLRNHLMAAGLRVMGQPSPLVVLRLPPDTAPARTALLESAGILVTLLRAPFVAGHAPRWRLQLTADHGPADIDDLADLIRDVSRCFDRRKR